MYKINITKPAENDIISCTKYIAVELQNITPANNLLDSIEKSIFSLNEMPYRCPQVSDLILSNQGLRFIQIENYLLFYTIREEIKTVVIQRFFICKT